MGKVNADVSINYTMRFYPHNKATRTDPIDVKGK